MLIFCVVAATVVLLLKCMQVMCNRNRRVARETPCDVVDTELVDLDDGGHKIVINPDGEIMAAMTSTNHEYEGCT